MANGPTTTEYWHNNGDFGPADLKDAHCPMALLSGYEQLGNGSLSEGDWLARYKPKNEWLWPPNDGFANYSDGKQISAEVELGPGMLLDRFGGDGTAFFCAYGTPFAMRSLPGCVLLMTYEVYRVTASFVVKAGTAIPWFEQPGLCLQLLAKDFKTAKEMIEKGYLHILTP